MNLFVGEIFKESKEFCEASINAIKVAAFFWSAQYKSFIGQIRSLQKESYSKYIALQLTLVSKFDPSESLNAISSLQTSLYLLAELSSILINEACKWLIYYYEVWSCNKLKSILYEYEQFRTQSYPFDKKSIDQFEGEAFSFWT
ncbi:hypothetical protein F8M41_020444 [Gigaspora margarita]|uniref:Uncharacterized protein n=1 Tax=Gigaspora margarita TaxID=4874 RepID=A0A8H4EJR0_GIGMA|nr:hypothetical protein F8M41_020444 [Gigaspora margarita]